jgi:hypothetical protein
MVMRFKKVEDADALFGVFANLTTLKNIDTTDPKYVNHSRAYVDGEGEFVLRKSSTFVDNGSTIIQPIAGDGRWIKVGVASEYNATKIILESMLAENGSDTLELVTGRGATTTNAISISNTTASSGVTSGALVVTGGVGISGALNASATALASLTVSGATQLNSTLGVTGIASITNNTVSSGVTSGALVVTGGVGISGALNATSVYGTTIESSEIIRLKGTSYSTKSQELYFHSNFSNDAFTAVLYRPSGVNQIRIKTGINNTEHTDKFTFDDNGNFTAAGDVFSNSDARLKDNVTPYGSALDKVNALEPVRYQRNDLNNKDEIGFIAQAVKEVEPLLVGYEESLDIYSLDYGRMVVMLTQAVKELTDKVKKLEDK